MPAIRIHLTLVLAGLAGFLAIAPSAVLGAATPDEFVANIGTRALAVMSNQRDGNRVPLEVRRLFAESFDLELIGRFVLGRSLDKVKPTRRSHFGRLAGEYVLSNNVKILARFAGGTFAVDGTRTLDDGDFLVNSTISANGEVPLTVYWRLRITGGHHKVIDLIVAGVSLLKLERDEFASIARRHGVEALLNLLRQGTADAPPRLLNSAVWSRLLNAEVW